MNMVRESSCETFNYKAEESFPGNSKRRDCSISRGHEIGSTAGHTIRISSTQRSIFDRCCHPHNTRTSSQVHSQIQLMAHSKPAGLYGTNYALKTLSITLLSTLSSTLPIAFDYTLPGCMTVCSQGRCQNTPMYTSESLSSTCPIANQMPGTRGHKAGVVWLAVFGRPQMVCGWCPIVDGRQCMLAKMMTSVNMVILTLLSVWPPGQDLKLSQGYGVENRSLICSRKDKQLDFTESRSHTQFSHRDVR